MNDEETLENVINTLDFELIAIKRHLKVIEGLREELISFLRSY